MVDFISEVQEELRKDDYNKWLKQYGPWALAGIALVVGGAGFMEWREAQDTRKASQTSASFLAASNLAAENKDGAIADFLKISESAPSGYSGLALMQAANLKLEEGDPAKAVELLDQAATTFEMPRHIQLAQIKAVYILAGEGDYAQVIARATPLAEKDQPFEYLARELLGFAHMQNGDKNRARAAFAYLERTPGVPETIQARAKQNLGIMGPSEVPAEKAPAEEGAPAENTGATDAQASDAPAEDAERLDEDKIGEVE